MLHPRARRAALAAGVCAALGLPGVAHAAYAPKLTASISPTTPHAPMALTTTVTQKSSENASKTVKVLLPVGFGVNLFTTAKPCPADAQAARSCPADAQLGTASAQTMYGPFTGPVDLLGVANGDFQLGVYLSGNALGVLPQNQDLKGVASPTANGILTTFDNLPNILTTSLTLKLSGPPQTLLATPTKCGDYTISGDFTSQKGEHATSSSTVTISGCPPPAPRITKLKASPAHPKPGRPGIAFHVSGNTSFTIVLRERSPKKKTIVKKSWKLGAGQWVVHLPKVGVGRYTATVSAFGDGGKAVRHISFRVRP